MTLSLRNLKNLTKARAFVAVAGQQEPRQVGNAVPVRLARAVLEAVTK